MRPGARAAVKELVLGDCKKASPNGKAHYMPVIFHPDKGSLRPMWPRQCGHVGHPGGIVGRV